MSLRLRRGTDLQRQTITFNEGELVYTTDTKKVYIGDGVTLGGNLVTGAPTSGGEVIDDTTPQLGGNLDLNNFDITGIGNINITGTILSTGTIGTNSSLFVGDKLGVGTEFPQEALDVLGNAYFSGTAEASIFLGDLSGNLLSTSSTVIVNYLTGDINSSILTANEASISTVLNSNIINANSGSIANLDADVLIATSISGDLRGSVFSDDSVLLVDGITGTLTGSFIGQLNSKEPGFFTVNALSSGEGGGSTLEFYGYGATEDAPEPPSEFARLGLSFNYWDGTTYALNSIVNSYYRNSGAGYLALAVANNNGDFFFDTAIEIDGEDGLIYITSENGVIFNNTITANGGVVGDLVGSVFADDSTVLVDSVNGNINLTNNVLGDLGNVDVSGAVVGQVLKFDGTNWVAQSDLSGGGSNTVSISGATQANPVVITTSTAHNFFNGQSVTITDIVGMVELNGNIYYADVLTSDTFALYSDDSLTTPVNGTGFTAYTSGGNATGGASTNALTLNNQNGSYYLDWANFTNTPTTIAGYGIIDAFDGDFASLTNVPTTLSGYGITDAVQSSAISVFGFSLIDDADALTARTTLGLGSAATTDSTDYATAAQGALADTALQPGDTLIGELKGSVFADDSTLLVDAVNGIIPKANIQDSVNWDSAYSWGDHALEGYITATSLGSLTFTGSVIDTSDSSLITVTPAVTFSSDVTVQNDLIVTNKIIATTLEVENIITNASGTPELSSDTDIILNAGTRVEVSSSPFKLASFTTAERDLLVAQNGDMIYNTSVNKFQGYANGIWVDLH